MAAPYDPVAAYARKVKRERHRKTLLRDAGQAPPPVKESRRLFEQRIEREQRAVRQNQCRADVPRENTEPTNNPPLNPLRRHGRRRSAGEAVAATLSLLSGGKGIDRVRA
jgi:hypothetical protein